MATVHVVTYSVGGYAREDADTLAVGGAYTDIERAKIHAMMVHGTVTTVELDIMPAGIESNAKTLGLIK